MHLGSVLMDNHDNKKGMCVNPLPPETLKFHETLYETEFMEEKRKEKSVCGMQFVHKSRSLKYKRSCTSLHESNLV